MKKSNLDSLISHRLVAKDFAQPKKLPVFTRIWRKLCAAKTA